MPFYGSIVVIRRTGLDGSIFPLVSSECLMGRAEGCDIRVQLPTVSGEHCKVTINNSDQVRIVNEIMLPGVKFIVIQVKLFASGFRWLFTEKSRD